LSSKAPMLELIKKLQKKPKNYRRRLAILFSLTFTFLVFVLWVVAFYRSEKIAGGGGDGREESSYVRTPLSSIKSSLGSVFREVDGLLNFFDKSPEETEEDL